MENTLENKAKLFAQYWGQEVLRVDSKAVKSNFSQIINRNNISIIYDEYYYTYIILKKEVTDIELVDLGIFLFDLNMGKPDFKEVVNICQKIVSAIIDGNHRGFDTNIIIKSHQYLVSKGYALPYMGLSVEQLIEYGWIKLL